MKLKNLLLAILFLAEVVCLFVTPARAQTMNRIRPVPDVIVQFDELKHHGEWMGFHMGAGAPDPTPRTGSAHWQGMGRYQDSENTPYIIISLNAQKNSGQPGGLAIVRMNSREKHAERMRSNRLLKGSETEDTAPPPNDKIVKWFTLPTFYDHPGGIQIVGDVVAVAMVNADADRSTQGNPDGAVMFVDLSGLPDLDRVKRFPYFLGITASPDKDINRIGAVGLTQLLDGHFLLVVQNLNGKWLHFYKSLATTYDRLVDDLSDSDLPVPGGAFRYLDSWSSDECIGNWYREIIEDPSSTSFQTINLVTQEDGRVFLIGARNKNKLAPFAGINEDWLQLYEVENYDGNGDIIVRSRPSQGGKHMFLRNAGSGLNGNFNAASGVYISPTGELLLYAAEHDNDGPPGGEDGFVRMAEFRNEFMARVGSPLNRPVANAGGKKGYYSVEEGSSISLDGSGSEPPFIKPWVELYEHDNFEGRSVVLDWDDRYLEDWRDFGKLDGANRGFHDQASSVRWQAPLGCNIGLYKDTSYQGKMATLEGDGTIRSYTDLGNVKFDGDNESVGDEISAMRFLGTAYDCGQTEALNFLWSNLNPDIGSIVGPVDEEEIEYQAGDGPGRAEVMLTVCTQGNFCDTKRVPILVYPTVYSPTHQSGQPSCEQVVTLEWGTPGAAHGLAGYSYIVVNQDDPYYGSIREPDDTVDLAPTVTSFTTPPLEPGHIWEFNIRVIDTDGLASHYFASFTVDIETCGFEITHPDKDSVFQVGNWESVDSTVEWDGNEVNRCYVVETVDLYKGTLAVANLLSNVTNIGSLPWMVPHVETGSDYKIGIRLVGRSVGGCPDEVPQRLLGFSEYFTIIGLPSIPGDMDGDGDVDYTDFDLLLDTFNKCDGDPGYAEAADLDGDGCINCSDYQEFISLFPEAGTAVLSAVEYSWGDPAPGCSFDWPIFEAWMNVRVENTGAVDAENVVASILTAPENCEIVDGDATVGNVTAGSSSWSSDTFTVRVDMSILGDPDEGIFWKVEYDADGEHFVEVVPEFPGTVFCDE